MVGLSGSAVNKGMGRKKAREEAIRKWESAVASLSGLSLCILIIIYRGVLRRVFITVYNNLLTTGSMRKGTLFVLLTVAYPDSISDSYTVSSHLRLH